MDGGQWLTVQEFAKAAGVSDKAIYSRLNRDLKPYLKTDKKRKYVNSAALDSINFQSVEARTKQEDSNRINLIQEVEQLKAERDQLRQDLHALEISAAVAAAERDAARQHEQEQAATIRALTESLHMAQEQTAALTAALTAAQSLHAGTIRGQLEQAAQRPDDDLAKRDAVISTDGIAKRDAVTADVVKHDVPRPDRQKAHGASTKKKMRILSRFFGRK